MKYQTFLLLSLFLVKVSGNPPDNNTLLKPRIVVLTDVSTWETDDSESLVRLLVHADLFEMEGLIYTTGWSLEETREDFMQLIHDAIDAYDKDLPNLMKRSGQSDFMEDESRQSIGYWPSADYLRSRTMFGSTKRGIQYIGINNVSDGSNLIIREANENDERPVWILIWGGGNTLAQAVWQVQQEKDDQKLSDFLKKVPVYAITDQDRAYTAGTPYDISSHYWLRKEFEKDLMFLWDECAWKYQNGKGRDNWEAYERLIQSRGNLGKVYPKYKYGVEGDTPAFLHVLPNGLNDPMDPGQVGWGGYFVWGSGPDKVTRSYTNHEGEAYKVCHHYETYFYPATFNNFAARMDWADKGTGNRNPVAIVNGDKGIAPLNIQSKPGKKVKLDASQSFDPDNDQLTFKWWVLPEAGTFQGDLIINGKDTVKAVLQIPPGSAGKTLHVICEITDNGSPSLTSYRRIIVHSR